MLLGTLLVTLLGLTLQAQAPAPNPFGPSARSTTSHLTVESRISPEEAAPGATLTVALDITPRRSIHVYAPGKHDYQVIALTLDAQPWLRLEPTKYPPSEKYHFAPLNETVEVYSQPFRLTRTVRVLDTPEARRALAFGTATVTGQLEYQACDDRVCFAPSKVAVRLPVRLTR
jgi:hypothetical protein